MLPELRIGRGRNHLDRVQVRARPASGLRTRLNESCPGGIPLSEPLTPEQRVMRARIAGHTRSAQLDPAGHHALARSGQSGLLARFEREADPDGVLSEADRRFKAQALYKLHMSRLAFASNRARHASNAEKRAARREAEAAAKLKRHEAAVQAIEEAVRNG